ncbi:tetratricopeptide repeat protein [Halochromatium sp.]
MSAPLPKLEGRFDGIFENHACGWLYSADAPRTRLEVELVSDDEQVVARGIANCFRQSLLEAGIGDGKHAFSIPVPASLSDGEAHRLSIREAYSGQALEGGGQRFQAAAMAQPAASPAARPVDPAGPSGPAAAPRQAHEALRGELSGSDGSSASVPQSDSRSHGVALQGCFDRVAADRAIGWVFSPDAPGTRLEVEIICGDQVVARGRANLDRADLVGAGYGDGRHGFDLPVERSLCQGPESLLSAREAYSGQTLPGSPQRLDAGPGSSASAATPAIGTVQGGAAAGAGQMTHGQVHDRAHDQSGHLAETGAPAAPLRVHGHFDDLLNGNADGWVFFPEQPQLRAEVEVLCDGQVVARGRADRLRADLEEAGIADGRCAFSVPIDPALLNGQRHQISVREQRSGQLLDGGPMPLPREASGSLGGSPLSHPQPAEADVTQPHGAAGHDEFQSARPTESALRGPKAEQRNGANAAGHPGGVSAPALQGRLEAVRHGHIEGWALDPVDPMRRLELEVLCDGHLQGRCAADLYRPDLADAGIGDGKHAFSLPLNAALFDGQSHAFVVRERHAGQLLEGSPLTCRLDRPASPEPEPSGAPDCSANDAPGDWGAAAQPTRVASVPQPSVAETALVPASGPPTPPSAPASASGVAPGYPVGPTAGSAAAPQTSIQSADSELQGRFEGVINGQVCGWAIDPLHPEMRVELELLCDGEPLARIRADLEREDLAEVALGDGRHGFRLTLDPRLFDGQPHELSVRVHSTQQLLPGSPQRLQSGAPPARVRSADVQGAFEAVSGTRAVGYAWDLSRPEHRLEVEILCEGEIVGRAAANTFRRDLYESGIGDGRHAFSAPISYELLDAKPHWLTAREAHTGKSLTHGPHLFEQASANWPFDLMPRSETLKQLEELLAEPGVASRAPDAEQCRGLLRDACLRQEMRQTEAARAIYRQLLAQLGENALCHCKLAETWLLDGEPDPALDAYRRAAALPLPMFWAYLGIGNAFKLRDQFVESEDAYHSALRISPREPRVLRRLDEVRLHAVPLRVDRLIADGQIDEGIRLLKTRLIEEPDNQMLFDKLSTLLARQHDSTSHSAVAQDDEVIAFDSSLRILELLLADGDRQLRGEGQR